MNQQEFENGIGVNLDYIPCKLKAQWFREIELYYMNKCSNKEEAYKRFRSEIRTRVKELKEFRFSSNLELQACLGLALKELDKQYGADGARDRHEWFDIVREYVGNNGEGQYYSEINSAIQAVRKVVEEADEYDFGATLEYIKNACTERLFDALEREAKFETESYHSREQIALTIVALIVNKRFSDFWIENEDSIRYGARYEHNFALGFYN